MSNAPKPSKARPIDMEVISQNARRIAHGLGVRGTRQQLPGRIVDRCHRLLAAARTSGQPIYHRLANICQQIHPPYKRHFLTCLVLLDRLWLVLPGSVAAQELVRLIRESYHLCDRSSFKAILRDELIEKQWSSFRVVRLAASQIREIEQVDGNEANSLGDSRAFPDIRAAVARRILLHRQAEHLDKLLHYLVETVRTGGEDSDERCQAEQMFGLLREFGMSVVLVPLCRAYVEHYSENTVRGYLMRALASFGDLLVPQLEELYRGDSTGAWGRPIMRLLHQMMARGSPEAVRVLADIVVNARGSDLDEAAQQFLAGARERAARGLVDDRTELIRERIAALIGLLEDSRELVHRRLSRELVSLTWDTTVTGELIERIVSRLATTEEHQRLRHGGIRAAELLIGVIQDESRTVRQRIDALEVLPTIYGSPGRSGPEDLLWRIYRQAATEELRMAALKSLTSLELEPPDPTARQILFDEYHQGTPAARCVIGECWAKIFPNAPPPAAIGHKNAQEGRP